LSPESAVTANWLSELRAQVDQPPRRPREPPWAGAARIGSIEAGFLGRIGLQPAEYMREQLSKQERSCGRGWHLTGDVTASLGELAMALRDAGVAAAWRNEQLAVVDTTGRRVGTVERAVARVFGIATHAVHLLAQTRDRRHWVQQRAFDKADDPGLWDTVVGGMVPADETPETALQRETWEQAGLHATDLQGLRHGSRLRASLPEGNGSGPGYVVEQIDWYRCVVPDGLTPVNQDGEVARFALMGDAQLAEALQQRQFTLDACHLAAGTAGRPHVTRLSRNPLRDSGRPGRADRHGLQGASSCQQLAYWPEKQRRGLPGPA
jgi:8-oxo-dGTP pyrophosphatase MutT (NUDIX family)